MTVRPFFPNGWKYHSEGQHEDRLRLRTGYLTEAEKRVLKDQGVFIERINWQERVFIPTGGTGLEVFERITQSKTCASI